MKHSKKDTVGEREKENFENAELVRSGYEQFSFFAERNPEVTSDLNWFGNIIREWDTKNVDEGRSVMNRMQHIDAFCLQRDVNYAYSDRKRLMEIGLDTRFEAAYMARVKAKLYTNMNG